MKKELNNDRKEVCGIIYAIRNKVNDKYYIGQTVNDNIYIRYKKKEGRLINGKNFNK